MASPTANEPPNPMNPPGTTNTDIVDGDAGPEESLAFADEPVLDTGASAPVKPMTVDISPNAFPPTAPPAPSIQSMNDPMTPPAVPISRGPSNAFSYAPSVALQPRGTSFTNSADGAVAGPPPAPPVPHFTISRKEQAKREKEDKEDEDWERRLYWTRDLFDILGVEGLLKYDPNNRYRLRKNEVTRRQIEKDARKAAKEARRKAREGQSWAQTLCPRLWGYDADKGPAGDPGEDIDDQEVAPVELTDVAATNGAPPPAAASAASSQQGGEEAGADDTAETSKLPFPLNLPLSGGTFLRDAFTSTMTSSTNIDEDMDYQMVLEVVRHEAEAAQMEDLPSLPTDPADPEYRTQIHYYSQMAKKVAHTPFYRAACCGMFPVLWPAWRLRLRRTLRDPRFSFVANMWSLLMALTIITSVATLVLESVQELEANPTWRAGLSWAALGCLFIFTVELLLTWLTMKNISEFFTLINLINILTVFPPALVAIIRLIYLDIPSSGSNDIGFTILSVLQHLLVLRVFKLVDLSARSTRMSLMFQAVRSSGDGIFSLIIVDFILMIFFSTIVFYAETSGMYLKDGVYYYTDTYGGGVSGFQNIPITFWFVIVSITTTGYGDLVPRTPAGQSVTSLMLVFAVALLAFPLAIINSNFSALVAAQDAGKRERQERRRMQRQRTAYVKAGGTLDRSGTDATSNGYPLSPVSTSVPPFIPPPPIPLPINNGQPTMTFRYTYLHDEANTTTLTVPTKYVAVILKTNDPRKTLQRAGWKIMEDNINNVVWERKSPITAITAIHQSLRTLLLLGTAM